MKILEIRGKLYNIKRSAKGENAKDFEIICEKIFKREDVYYFCDEIADAKIEYEELISERKITQIIDSFLNGAVLNKENQQEYLDKFMKYVVESNQNLNFDMIKYIFKKKIENKMEKI